MGGAEPPTGSARIEQRESGAKMNPHVCFRSHAHVVVTAQPQKSRTSRPEGHRFGRENSRNSLSRQVSGAGIRGHRLHGNAQIIAEAPASTIYLPPYRLTALPPSDARGGIRTRMGLPPRDFKSLAYTDFATRARGLGLKRQHHLD